MADSRSLQNSYLRDLVPGDAVPGDLAVVMQRLRKVGIPCHVEIGETIVVGLGANDYGPSAEARFSPASSADAARWLDCSALILFALNYALLAPRRFDPVGMLARWWRPF